MIEQGSRFSGIRSRSRFMRLWLIGMSDGLTIPFAVLMALAGAAQTNTTIVICTLLAAACGALLMGLSGYYSGKAEDQHYSKPKTANGLTLSEFQKKELEKTPVFLAKLDIHEEIRNQASEELIRENKKWNEFITTYELTTDPSAKSRNGNKALIIGLSFFCGAFIPLLSFVFFQSRYLIIFSAVCLMIVAQAIFGYLKGVWTGTNPFANMLRAVLLSSAAATLAWFAGQALGKH
jgi:VIT1/CCC1 family predicted Fe2+/Mn2+ transporter